MEGRIKAAGFPAIHRLEEYDVKRMAELDEQCVFELHRFDLRRAWAEAPGAEAGLGEEATAA